MSSYNGVPSSKTNIPNQAYLQDLLERFLLANINENISLTGNQYPKTKHIRAYKNP